MAGRDGDCYLGDSIADGGYEISYDMLGLDGFCTVGDEFATVLLASAKYPWFIAWAQATIDPNGFTRTPNAGAPAWSDAEVLSCYSIVAAWNNEVWKTGGAIGQGWRTDAEPLSRSTIHAPQGSFAINFPLMTAYGNYLGYGSDQSAAEDNAANQTTYGTTLFIDHTNWIDDGAGSVGAPERYCMRSVNFIEEIGGVLYGGINGNLSYQVQLNANYQQGCYIAGFKFDGKKDQAPEAENGGYSYVSTYHSSGVAILRSGSVSQIMRCRADNFNNAGFELVGGTPNTLNTVRTLFNNYAGIWIRGAAVTSITSHEGDDNPTMTKITAYSTPSNANIIEAGGRITVNMIKMEGGTQSMDGVDIIQAGTAAVNEILYYRDGDLNTYGKYVLLDGSTTDDIIYRDPAGPNGDRWYVENGGVIRYYGTPAGGAAGNFPWNSSSWTTAAGGTAPAPSVRQARPNKGQMALDCDGWINATYTGVDFVGVNSFIECLFRIFPSSNVSAITVIGLNTYGYVRTLVHHCDGANSRKWFLDRGMYEKKWFSITKDFYYVSNDGGRLTSIMGSPRQVDVTYEDRLMWIEETSGGNNVETWDDATGTPVWYD